MAKYLALPISDHEVLGANPAGGGIQFMTGLKTKLTWEKSPYTTCEQ